MNLNPTIILKVPEGLLKKANEQGILTDVLFWYKLRALNIEGRLKKDNIYNELSKTFGLSFSTVWNRIQKLIKLGYIKEYKNYYQLIKYDDLFQYIGFEIRNKKLYSFINNYIGTIGIKIFKIESNNINKLLEFISYEELKLNFKKQAYQIIKKIKQNKSTLKKTIPKNVLNEVKLNSLDSINLIYNYTIDLNKEEFWNKESDYDITISCKSFANLLGYSSSQTGYSLLYKLSDLDLIYIKTRKILIEGNDYFAKILYDKYKSLSAKYIMENGMLYYNNTNKIILN